MRIEHHWWNRNTSARGRRDVYIRTDGERWEVEARIGGATGRSRLQECPSRAAATILAQAWRGDGPAWPELTKPQGRRPIGPLGESTRAESSRAESTRAESTRADSTRAESTRAETEVRKPVVEAEPVDDAGDLTLQPRS